ncbi:MAG: UV DNA damage repair endonuclease UvsE [bacterium]|nr:UV DNA damage repair endonuclease UvsE [bacterium]
MKINLGYCCISHINKKLKVNRSSTKTYLENHDASLCHEYLLEKARQNIKDLELLLYENKKNDIYAYRLPEQILPQIDLGYYSIEDVRQELKEVGEVANQLNMQLSTHPSQYFVLNSLRPDVVEKSIGSLNLFSDTFAAMELEKVPNVTLHVGVKNGYETVEGALDQFCENYLRLNENARNYLVLENDHVSFTVDNCLYVHQKIGIPIVFDNKHFEWNPGKLSYDECVREAAKTWKERIPKFHLASDKEGNKHAHDDYIHVEDYLKMVDAMEKAGMEECNVMLECKEKDLAILKLREDLK